MRLRSKVKKVVLVSVVAVCSLIAICTTLGICRRDTPVIRGEQNEQRSDRPISQEVRDGAVESNTEVVKKRFQHRRDLLDRACRLYGNSSLFRPVRHGSLEPIPLYRPVMNISVRYCGIAKTASTTWGGFFGNIKKHMTALGIKPSEDQNPSKDGEVYFTFVREPYARLWSAYVDKLLTPNVVFWRSTGRYIVQTFREGASKNSPACGHDVTFPEFIKYVIHAQKTIELHRDGHFIPIHDQCDLCHIPYHYIGHLETIHEDMPYIVTAIQSPIRYNQTYDVDTIKQNARMVFIKTRKVYVEKCMDIDEASRRLWKKYQIRGLISKHESFPYPPHTAVNITFEEFISAAVNAYKQSVHSPGRKTQRNESLREAFAQISMEDRLQLQQMLFLDFQMFGFDPYLEDVFPKEPYVEDKDFSYLKLF